MTRLGIPYLSARGRLGEALGPRRFTEVGYTMKALPRCDPEAKGGFDADPLLVRLEWQHEQREVRRAEGELVLRESPFDPVADLPVRRIVRMEYEEGTTAEQRPRAAQRARPSGCCRSSTSATTTPGAPGSSSRAARRAVRYRIAMADLGAALRRHPVITGVMLGCTLLGAVLGVLLLTDDWSLARRLAAGAVGGPASASSSPPPR